MNTHTYFIGAKEVMNEELKRFWGSGLGDYNEYCTDTEYRCETDVTGSLEISGAEVASYFNSREIKE